ncbi:MAG: hypothetical protein LBG57_02355 [Treponema sp.]|jgi:hypothetical protein|nr:hypothetical protein [Treponema sp.]
MRWIWLLPLFLVPAHSGAQDTRQGPYIIPRIVYVGDRATLTLPLAGGNAVKEANISLDPQLFPLSPDLELYRVALEYRPSGSQLLIEFSAFRPGLLELPPIEIGGERFAGLRVEISSILDTGETGEVLSGPALPLAIPGTGLLIYGTMGLVALLLLLALWAGLWGRRHLRLQILKWKRRRLIVSMWGMEKRLRRSVQREGKYRDTLNKLSGEFRSFLSFFTGQNCLAMTAAEIGQLPSLMQANGGSAPEEKTGCADYAECQQDFSNGGFLGGFFRRCDELRFCGSEIAAGDVLAILGDLRRFLKTLDRAGRGKLKAGEEAA